MGEKTCPGGQIDASIVVQHVTTMISSNFKRFLAVLHNYQGWSDMRTKTWTDLLIEMQERI